MNKPKKSLGQNFLTSVGAVRKIVETALICGGRTSDIMIVEVGPGRGVLTAELVKKFDKVIAIEKDRDLISFLNEKFASEITAGKLKVVEADILELDPITLDFQKFAFVANIPYYITGQFLKQWLTADKQPRFMVLMLQKEVAQRIVAKDGKESLLSLSVKAYGEPKYIETIKRGSFYPIPNVDSAILKIDKISKRFFRPDRYINVDEGKFFSTLRAGFAHKRKFLAKNLETNYLDKQKIENAFKTCAIGSKSRAEELGLDEWRCLTQNL
ncbi:MAG: ribosomal RNA small subunit methyltransferase A [Candidatus Vogelbacteria bacterium]|nr:ribosomal RNA small subunit methyltransferase A [Candidatus Vogelbacteria bacterium]